jgi:hypothetical protein
MLGTVYVPLELQGILLFRLIGPAAETEPTRRARSYVFIRAGAWTGGSGSSLRQFNY